MSTGVAQSLSTPSAAGGGAEAEHPPEPGMALCLSGGGYRAMLFHLGTLWRLNELGILGQLKRISSVSGGSITAGVLATRWKTLGLAAGAASPLFVDEVVNPLRALAGTTIDLGAIGLGLLLPGGASDQVAAAYRSHLFGTATLQGLPDEPRFIFNATNVQSGALWRFSKKEMGDWRVGLVRAPEVEVAIAVAASSAFPPFLSPLELDLSGVQVAAVPGTDLSRPPFTTKAVLTDGGVYDNLGLEPIWKRYQTILVSDGGGKMAPEEAPAHDWPRHAYRILDVIDNQVRSLRKRQLIDGLNSGARQGTYWGIRTDIANYQLADALAAPHSRTLALAEVGTRLEAMPEQLQERLINWGYAVCDAAMRKHVLPDAPKPQWPHPASGV